MNDHRGQQFQQQFQQQYQQPYQQQYQQPYAYQNQNQYPHPDQQPHPHPHPQPPRLPALAGEGRRTFAVIADLGVALGGAILVAKAVPESGLWWAELPVTYIPAASFVNQWLLTLLFRGSAGKLLFGVRVMRAADGGRPGPIRALNRWLAGLCWLPLQPWYWLRENFGGSSNSSVRRSWTGELYDTDIAGLRAVRRKDLAAFSSSRR
ncbi:RDD family protein [Streptomyces sp. NPDC050658]|uniref:RDD family protein n=1 Tax=unclassified Streptomyces TaxID=2593676 RepID=UPI00343791F8